MFVKSLKSSVFLPFGSELTFGVSELLVSAVEPSNLASVKLELWRMVVTYREFHIGRQKRLSYAAYKALLY